MRNFRPLTGALLAGALTVALAAPAAADATTSPSPSPSVETASATPTATASAAAAASNSAPTAMPDNATVVTGATAAIAVLANDSDPDGDDLTVTDVTNPQDGSTDVDGDGHGVTYTSNSGFVGTDTFNYTVSDGHNGNATATVTVTVNAVDARANTINVPASVIALRTTSITGTVDPASPAPVSVALERLISGRWSTRAYAVASSTGAYSFSYATTAAGPIVWRTVATWADKTTAASAQQTMNVVARMDAVVSGPLTRADVPYSYRPGCPVSPAGLRRITMTFLNYKGILKRGQLIVSSGSVSVLLDVFQKGFTAGFPIKKMFPTDRYYKSGTRSPTKSDKQAMKHGDTSAFNCRPVTGNPYRQSQHSYGNAIDINTFENPYVTASHVYPPAAKSFLNRKNHRKGMLLKKGPIRTAMRAHGWPWGGRWSHPDYQHFSSNGG